MTFQIEPLDRCPECKQENHLPSASKGICVWCGFGPVYRQEPKLSPEKERELDEWARTLIGRIIKE